MKAITTLTALLLILISSFSLAQITDTIQVEKDALIRQFGGEGDNTNWGDYAYINMQSWTNAFVSVNHRSLIDFDLSVYPFGTTILNSQLFLYVDKHSNDYPDGHVRDGNSNSCVVRRVIEDWEEYQVTWNNHPASTTLNDIVIDASVSNYQDYVIDVTDMVQDMIDDPAVGFGFIIQLTQEVYYKRLVFASSDNIDTTIHPILVINFEPSGILTEEFDSFKTVAFPNPFSISTTIKYNLTKPTSVQISVYNHLGEQVDFIQRNQPQGKQQVIWYAEGLPSGIYYYRMLAGDQVASGKMVLVR